MESRKIINEQIQYLQNEDSINTQRMTELFNLKITSEDIADLETLINLLEIREESLKQTRRKLQLIQQTYLMTYMASYSRNVCEKNE